MLAFTSAIVQFRPASLCGLKSRSPIQLLRIKSHNYRIFMLLLSKTHRKSKQLIRCAGELLRHFIPGEGRLPPSDFFGELALP